MPIPTDIQSSPFIWVEFAEDATLKDPSIMGRLEALMREHQATDLLVISHGWKNEQASAEKLYAGLWTHTVAALTRIDPRRVVIAGVLWPAVTRRQSFDEAAFDEVAATGALAVGGAGTRGDISDAQLDEAIADYLDGEPDDDFATLARTAAQNLSADAAKQLVERTVASLGQDSEAELKSELGAIRVRAANDPKSILKNLSILRAKPKPVGGGGLGLEDVAGKIFGGAKSAVARWLNTVNYYKMKERAGRCGVALGENLAVSAPVGQVRLHLAGHSFGARLVTAAAHTLASQGRKAATLTLLQGAFSQHAISPDYKGKAGAFAGAPHGATRIAVTHTHNDRACYVAYAWASLAAGQVASGVGDADSPYGAMGANGAQHIPVEAHHQTPGPGAPAPVNGVNNYLADAWIKGDDAHGDVKNAQAGALLASILQA